MLNGCAYARIYGSSAERTAALTPDLDRYNHQRPTAASATNRPHHG